MKAKNLENGVLKESNGSCPGMVSVLCADKYIYFKIVTGETGEMDQYG